MGAEPALLARPEDAEHDGGHPVVRPSEATSVLLISQSGPWQAEVTALLEAEGYTVHLHDRGDVPLGTGDRYDVAVVDLAISGGSATAAFAALGSPIAIPILAVAPNGIREPAILDAYAAGADQIVTRERPHELIARVRALLRRRPARPLGLSTGDARPAMDLDQATGRLRVAATEVALTVREAEILEALLQRPGRVVTREVLLAGAVGKAAARALDAHVRSVRQKLESAEGFRRIVAVRGVGFRLVPDADLGALDEERDPPVDRSDAQQQAATLGSAPSSAGSAAEVQAPTPQTSTVPSSPSGVSVWSSTV